MAQRQFSSSDTSPWGYGYGNSGAGALTISSDTTDATPNTTFSATSGSTAATFGSGTGFANGDLLLILQTRNGGSGAGLWELNAIASGGGTTSVTLTYATINAYDTTAQVYLLKQYSAVTINNAKTLTSSAWDGSKGGIVAFLCNGTISVAGTITASGKGYRGGLGPAAAGSRTQGEGNAGAGINDNAANGNGGGATIGGNGTAGGGGGNGAAGSNGATASGTGVGGSTAGVAGLTTVVLGGAGGGGRIDTGGSQADGGNGGGFILLIGRTVTITGALTSSGSNGVSNTTNSAGGGGGGAGGPILVKGQTLTLGTNLITTPAGTGGAGGFGFNGGNGGVGRIAAYYGLTISGSTTPSLTSTLDNGLNPSAGGAFLYNFI